MQNKERPPREFKQMQISDLPLRPKGNYINKFKTTEVITNYHRVNIGEYKEIYIYSFDCQPEISYDNRLFRNKLIKTGFEKLKQKIGIPIISGRNLYTIKKPEQTDAPKQESKTQLNTQEPTPIKKKNYPEIHVLVECEDKQYKLILKLVKTVNLADIMSPERSKSFVSLNFLNNLMKNLMRQLGFMQIGKSKKFFDARYKVKIPNTNLLMYSGYSTSFSILSTGIYLKVDTACKLVRTQTVLTYINNLYTFHKDKDKTQKRNIVVKEMVGKTVMANYGNSRYWRIEDIVFDNNTDDFIIDKQTNENLTQYYKKRYNLDILSKKQPLVKAKFQQKDTNFAILVPEFLLMTGIPEDFDQKLRREISENTSKTPEVRLNKIQDLMDRLNNQLGQDSSPLNIAEKLKITIEPDLAKIQARCLGNPTLLLGQHNSVQDNKCASFQLFNKPIYQASTQMKIKVVHFSHYDPRNILNLCQSTANNLKLNMRIQAYNLGQFNSKRSLGDIIQILEGKEFDRYNMVTLLLPLALKTHYKKIKRIAVLSKQINTQVVLESTLNKKGFASICTKILLQISAKTGNILWVPQPPTALSKRTMIIGVDLSSDKQVSGRVAVGFAASMDQNFSRYYSTTFFQQKGIQIIQKMKQLILKAISQYVKYNNQAPEQIIVLRDGCGEGQLRAVKQIQVQNVLESIRKAELNIKPALTFIVIDRKVSQKFFLQRNGSIGNPYYGTLINESVVSKNYDFYLIAQNCNRGTVTPTYYKVIYTDSKIDKICFNLRFYLYKYSSIKYSLKFHVLRTFILNLKIQISQKSKENAPEKILTSLLSEIYQVFDIIIILKTVKVTQIKYKYIIQEYLGENQLQNLECFQYCKIHQLKQLEFENNKIIDLAPLLTLDTRYLKKLSLSSNNIQSLKHLTFMNLIMLQRLFLDNNKISDLTYLNNINCPNFRTLWLSKNKISSIESLERTQFPRLQILMLFNNEIEDIQPLRKCFYFKLDRLWLSENKIYDIVKLYRINVKQLKVICINKNLNIAKNVLANRFKKCHIISNDN